MKCYLRIIWKENIILYFVLSILICCNLNYLQVKNWFLPGEVSTIKNTSFDLTDNFWWLTDSASIDSPIYGINSFSPVFFKLEDSAPGEPSEVTSLE